MKIYHSPKIEIEELGAEDVLTSSNPMGEGDYELPVIRPGAKGTIAGGSTVSNVAKNSGASNAFSAGDIFGLR